MNRRLIWTGVRVGLTIAIFAFLLRDIDWRAIDDALWHFSGRAVVALLVLIAADRLLMLARWVLLMRMTTDTPASELSRIFFVSSFVGSFLPAGVGGDAARAISVTRVTREPGAAVASVVIDRLLGLLAVALAGCVGIAIGGHLVPDALRLLTLVLSIGLVIASAAGLYADRLAALFVPSALQETTVGRSMMALSGDLGAYREQTGVLWRVSLLSFVVQAVRVLLGWTIGVGLGIPLQLSYYWVFMPLNILVTLLPLSVGGFGVPQGAMVWSLDPLGVSATQAFILSMLFTLAGTVGNLPGALLYVIGRARPAGSGLEVR